MIGAGHQSAFQIRAALSQRGFERVIGWNLHPEMLSRLADTAAEAGLPFEVGRPRPPRGRGRRHHHHHLLLRADPDGRPGEARHASRLHGHRHQGQAGGRGRARSPKATVFTDEVAQSVTIGEAQHAVAAGLIPETAITQIGAVITGTHPGRRSARGDHPLRRHRRRPAGSRGRRRGRPPRPGRRQGDRGRDLTVPKAAAAQGGRASTAGRPAAGSIVALAQDS